MRQKKHKRTFMVSVTGPNPLGEAPLVIKGNNGKDSGLYVNMMGDFDYLAGTQWKAEYISLSDAEALLKFAKKQGAHKDANVAQVEKKLVISWAASE